MAKTAYLFDFSVRTRVVADPNDFRCKEDLFDFLCQKAREQVLADPENYLFRDNGDYAEDEECPYGDYPDEEI